MYLNRNDARKPVFSRVYACCPELQIIVLSKTGVLFYRAFSFARVDKCRAWADGHRRSGEVVSVSDVVYAWHATYYPLARVYRKGMERSGELQ